MPLYRPLDANMQILEVRVLPVRRSMSSRGHHLASDVRINIACASVKAGIPKSH